MAMKQVIGRLEYELQSRVSSRESHQNEIKRLQSRIEEIKREIVLGDQTIVELRDGIEALKKAHKDE